jgi:signal transduction histidine kinase
MPSGGLLEVATRLRGDRVVLTVRDNGIGMSEQVLKEIFIPFFTTKDVNEGTGLGLPVVHGIVTSHGGTIRVESAPGQGARFEVEFPVSAKGEENGDRTDDPAK